MKRIGSVAIISLLALVGCENSSRLDKTVKNLDEKGEKSAAAPMKADHSGSLEERVARLEENYANYAESLDFLKKVYEQQKAQQKAQEERQAREEPDPEGVFAVDVTSNVKLGMVEGPSQAPITIVEAWDFA